MASRKLYNFRAALPEIAAMLDQADNKSALINAALKAHMTERKTPPPELVETWRQMARDLSGMATNCNQLARWANIEDWSGRKLTPEHFTDLAADAKALRAQLQALITFWTA